MFLLIALLLTGSVVLLAMVFVPLAAGKLDEWHAKKELVIAKEMDKSFYYNKSPKQIMLLYYILPPILGLTAFFLFDSLIALAAGALIGLFIPNLALKIRDARRTNKFNYQILDAIMILSSSLKGGLSLLQALEVLIEEMPSPMRQEIGLVVMENKMGITLEDSLIHLGKRMNIEELRLVINSILVSRETGGDLTKVLSRLSVTIRDNRKLKDSIKTLTLQGRLQGIIMSVLPFIFIWWVLMFNREHFDIMLHTQEGLTLLIVAGVLQIIGMFLIRKFSTIKV
ncbi:MAG: type II secretion system F family protein [Candidatus Omnitrophota bacterium]